MKKVLFSIAVLAVVATMTACGNKSAQPIEGQDAATSEQSTEAQPAEAAPTIALPTTIEKGTYTIGLPEGWSTLSANDKGCYVYKGDGKKPSEAVNGTFIIMQFQPSDGKTIEARFTNASASMFCPFTLPVQTSAHNR
jgi:predicted small lipoprotein YifL